MSVYQSVLYSTLSPAAVLTTCYDTSHPGATCVIIIGAGQNAASAVRAAPKAALQGLHSTFSPALPSTTSQCMSHRLCVIVKMITKCCFSSDGSHTSSPELNLQPCTTATFSKSGHLTAPHCHCVLVIGAGQNAVSAVRAARKAALSRTFSMLERDSFGAEQEHLTNMQKVHHLIFLTCSICHLTL